MQQEDNSLGKSCICPQRLMAQQIWRITSAAERTRLLHLPSRDLELTSFDWLISAALFLQKFIPSPFPNSSKYFARKPPRCCLWEAHQRHDIFQVKTTSLLLALMGLAWNQWYFAALRSAACVSWSLLLGLWHTLKVVRTLLGLDPGLGEGRCWCLRCP